MKPYKLKSLFRCQDIGDITQREQIILEIIKDHLNNILFSISVNSKANDGRKNLNYNIFTKIGVNSRMQLIKFIEKNEP